MRITNKIMQRNSVSNINRNKELEDTLTTQMSTQKKISRPSDDPVVAIRALRLRTDVTEIGQYYSKNIPDAESWMQVTEDAIKNLSEVVTKMIEQCTKGANGDLTSSDRQIIMTQLKALKDEVFATGDADYAGRYVFTGYRTDTSLSFQEKTEQKYTITEQLNKDNIDTVSYVYTGDIKSWTSANYNTGSVAGIVEQPIEESTVARIRLSYNDCDDVTPDIMYYADPVAKDTDGNPVMSKLSDSYTIKNYDSTDDIGGKDVYSYVKDNKDAVVFLKDKGELLLGENVAAKLNATKDNVATASVNESEIRITYEKTNFKATDLRPEHYFYTLSEGIEYNKDYLDSTKLHQAITYNVGFNQDIQVNTTADECFNLGIVREVDDLLGSLDQVIQLEDIKKQIEEKIATVPSTDTENQKILKNQLDAVDKALTYAKDICQKRYEKGITSMQKYLDDTDLALTNEGARSSKLELIKDRMQNQKTTFETLQSENEDIDITEVAIQLSSAELTYQAALTATGKIMQNTLMNYI